MVRSSHHRLRVPDQGPRRRGRRLTQKRQSGEGKGAYRAARMARVSTAQSVFGNRGDGERRPRRPTARPIGVEEKESDERLTGSLGLPRGLRSGSFKMA